MAQIGTVKLDTQNSGVVDVPVFETGDSASGIYEFVRVETASGAGFIPVTDPADATYPYLRVQSQNNGIVAVTDTPGSAIPDSGLYLDDHQDAKISNRDDYATTALTPDDLEPDEAETAFENPIRPEWSEEQGSVSLSEGQITFPSDSTTALKIDDGVENGTVEVQLRFASLDGDYFNIFFYTDEESGSPEGNGYGLRLRPSEGKARLKRFDGGGTTVIINATTEWSPTAGESDNFQIIRDGENWEVKINGVSAGTTIDTTHTGVGLQTLYLHARDFNVPETTVEHYLVY